MHDFAVFHDIHDIRNFSTMAALVILAISFSKGIHRWEGSNFCPQSEVEMIIKVLDHHIATCIRDVVPLECTNKTAYGVKLLPTIVLA